MHREFDPDDLEHRRAHAFEAADGQSHPHHSHGEEVHDHQAEHRRLYRFTAALGFLLGIDLLLAALGFERWRAPWGVSLVWVAALLGSSRIIYGALEALIHGKIGADLALAQASIAALILGEPFVAAEVVFIAMLGEVLEARTFARAQKAIHRLVDQTPRTARVVRDGQEIEVPSAQVLVGDLVRIAQGERIPVDGRVANGRSSVDQSPLTGESLPIDKGPGDRVFTGTINQFGQIEVLAEKVGHETTFGQVLQLVASARKRKSSLEKAADRYARYFLPIVEILALLTILSGYWIGWGEAWRRAVAVLVVACPCALVLATPAAVLAAMAWLARQGIVIKGGDGLERLASCDTFAFDKTGTLTTGKPEVARILTFDPGRTPDDLLRVAAAVETGNPHPLGQLILAEAVRKGIAPGEAEERTTLPGAGVSARVRNDAGDSALVLVGNRRLLEEQGIGITPDVGDALEAADAAGETPLLVAWDGRVLGLITATDRVRREAPDVIRQLKALKIAEIAVLTGDRPGPAQRVAARTQIPTVESELFPADKARWIGERQDAGRRVAMVGDGINDAPALAQAQVGIALAGVGSDLAAEAGDLLILGEPLVALPGLVSLSRVTMRVIRQNILIFAIGLNATAIASAALGWLGPVPAAILHQAGSLLVLLNAMRLLTFGRWRERPPWTWLVGFRRALRRFDDVVDLATLGEPIRKHRRELLVGLAAAGCIAYVTSGWRAIGPGEVGLVRRFGRFVEVRAPGLSLGWPWPVEDLTRIRPGHLDAVTVGFRVNPSPGEDENRLAWETSHNREGPALAVAGEESMVLTGDGQLVEVTAAVQYRLPEDPNALAGLVFGVEDPRAALRPISESALRSVLGRKAIDAILTGSRSEVEREVAREVQRRIDQNGLGLRIMTVAFQDVHPPLPVVDAYRDISRARSDRERRIREGDTQADEQLQFARSRASGAISQSEGASERRVRRAEGQADGLLARIQARAEVPGLIDPLLYLDGIASALAGRTKLFLDDGPGRRQVVLPEPGSPGLIGLDRPPNEPIGPPRP